MPKTTKTKTFTDGDVTVKLTVTDKHNVSKQKKGKKSTSSKRKTTRKRRKKSSGGRMFYDD